MCDSHCIVIFHGSKTKEAKSVAEQLVSNLESKICGKFSLCYLREGSPNLLESLSKAYLNGIKKITCLPLLLLPGSHSMKEIPEIIADFKKSHQDCHIEQLPCLAESSCFVDFIVKVIEDKNV